ncbi:MAG: putative DNA binding domain-containing protein [Pontiellaceae bacterium]|nr:putative DNA binding domain-containing protein [Pontiellaceae bacterium]MBN2784933.1 putative DNA binding domain-containing protein [Pontiellaceae bacterium]
MSTLRHLIDTLRAETRESEWLEFKRNNDHPQLIGEYLSALSNAACLSDKSHGYLIYGIDDETHDVVGTTFKPHDTKGKGNEGMEPWLARLLSPRMDFHIFEYDYDEKRVVIFRIDATVNTPVKFSGTAYVRVGEHKKLLSDYGEKERKIWKKTPPTPFEKAVALQRQSSDDLLKKLDYPAFFDLLDFPLPENRSGILEKLEEENVIVSTADGYSITNLGAILFAKDLHDFPALERKIVRVVVFRDDTKLYPIKEMPGAKGYAVGFESLIDWIYDQLPANELIEDALRVEQKMYPKVAIREFVANAIIHQDFSIAGAGPMVEIFATRMEITNPGKPLVEPDRFIDHSPISRNETLASLMRRMRICEEWGSGVDRAVHNIEIFQLPAPDFIAEERYTRVILFSYRDFKDMGRPDRVRACFQHCILRWLARDFMTNTTLRVRFGIKDSNYPMASKVIKEALEAGRIKLADPESKSGPTRKYIPSWG